MSPVRRALDVAALAPIEGPDAGAKAVTGQRVRVRIDHLDDRQIEGTLYAVGEVQSESGREWFPWRCDDHRVERVSP
jgi:hypothetical protein